MVPLTSMELEHEFGSRTCWCNPRLADHCPECGGKDPDCWRCDELGLVDVDIDYPSEVVIIHIDKIRGEE